MVNTIIAKVNSGNAIIDFRDKLSAPSVENYAQMHETGGTKKNSYPSVIRVTICDYSKGTGDNSVTVSVNIDPTLAYEWLEVSKKALGSTIIPVYEMQKKSQQSTAPTLNVIGRLLDSTDKTARVSEAIKKLLSGIMQHVANLVKGKTSPNTPEAFKEVGSELKAAVNSLKSNGTIDSISFKNGIDYQLQPQYKINNYSIKEDGYAPVSIMNVSHKPFRDEHTESTYPWYIKITNAEAVAIKADDGTYSFTSKTMRNKKEAAIMMSDRDMFRAMTLVTHFISAWETANCLPVIIQGEQMRKEEYEKIRSQNNHN